jgi:hypothetical protein
MMIIKITKRRRWKMGDTAFYIRNFEGDRCVCGGRKGTRISFCFTCYSILPKKTQAGLYNALKSRAYEEAFEAALDELKADGRVK